MLSKVLPRVVWSRGQGVPRLYTTPNVFHNFYSVSHNQLYLLLSLIGDVFFFFLKAFTSVRDFFSSLFFFFFKYEERYLRASAIIIFR